MIVPFGLNESERDLLDGAKRFVSGSEIADYLLVNALVDGEPVFFGVFSTKRSPSSPSGTPWDCAPRAVNCCRSDGRRCVWRIVAADPARRTSRSFPRVLEGD